jgi:hypothetical protein
MNGKYVTDKENRINLIKETKEWLSDDELTPLHKYDTENCNYIISIDLINNIQWLLEKYIEDFSKLTQIENCDDSEVMEALERMGKVVIGKNILFSDTFEYVNIKTYILKSQQQEKELSELKSKVRELLNQLDNWYKPYDCGYNKWVDGISDLQFDLEKLVGEDDD